MLVACVYQCACVRLGLTRRVNIRLQTLRAAQQLARATAPSACRIFTSHSTPPTYYKVGKITGGFQAIVEAYGVARYREHNPVPYAIIT